ALVAAPQRLAVERDHPLRPLDPRLLRKRSHKAPKCALEGLRIDHAEDATEGVVAWQTILEHQHVLPKVSFHPRKQRDVDTGRRTTQRCQQRQKPNPGQIVQRVVRPRVGQIRKTFRKSIHRWLPPNQESPSESISHAQAITYSSPHAIPLPLWGRVR